METAVRELKQVIADHDGANVADAGFARRVDELISVFYDDIGEITTVSTRDLFDLFVIKVLYVQRQSTDASIVDYLGRLLERYLYTRELFPIERDGKMSLYYLSDLLEETRKLKHFQNLFEAYRKYADNSLFVTGVFPRVLPKEGRTRRTRRRTSFVDRGYYVSTGKRFYLLASHHKLAESTNQRELLAKLSAYFEVYVDALNELSERYVTGFDLNLIADKMLDNFNQYRRTGEDRFLQNARRYAAILQVGPEDFPSLLKRRAQSGLLLEPPPDTSIA